MYERFQANTEPGHGVELSASEAEEAAVIERLIKDKAQGSHRHDMDIPSDFPEDVQLDHVLTPSRELTAEAADTMALEEMLSTVTEDIVRLETEIAQAQSQYDLFDNAGNVEAAAETYMAIQELRKALDVLKENQKQEQDAAEREAA